MYIYTALLSELFLTDMQLQPVLSADEWLRAQKFKCVSAKKAFMLGRYMLRHILGQRLNQLPQELVFAYGEKEKPHLVAGELSFNLSHSGDVVVLAVSNFEVGIDVEQVKSRQSMLELAERFFSLQEQMCIKNSSNPLQAFYQIWVAKEAYLKALGLGISAGLDSFSVMNKDNQLCAQVGAYHLTPLDLFDGYCAAVAAMNNEEIKVVPFTLHTAK
jgi:4'-phosphopantetheinyl transferase